MVFPLIFGIRSLKNIRFNNRNGKIVHRSIRRNNRFCVFNDDLKLNIKTDKIIDSEIKFSLNYIFYYRIFFLLLLAVFTDQRCWRTRRCAPSFRVLHFSSHNLKLWIKRDKNSENVPRIMGNANGREKNYCSRKRMMSSHPLSEKKLFLYVYGNKQKNLVFFIVSRNFICNVKKKAEEKSVENAKRILLMLSPTIVNYIFISLVTK